MRDTTYILAEQLSALGAVWKRAVWSDPRALGKWGLVGFRLSPTGRYFIGRQDSFALEESFKFCAENNIPVSFRPVGRLINKDPKQGGLNFMKYTEQLDAVIFSWIYSPQSTSNAETYRREAEKFGHYDLWTSLGQRFGGLQKAAEACGAKMIFVVGRTRNEVGTQEFEYPGSPYVALQRIILQSYDPDEMPLLGVLIHRDYAAQLGMKIPDLKPIPRAVAELQGNDIRLQGA